MDRRPDSLEKRIRAARGEILSDLVLRNGRLVNVFSSEVLHTDVAVYEGVIVGVGDGYRGVTETDLGGQYLIPGLIDGHLHIESTMLTPYHLAKALLVHGTTAVVADPHEIANVAGIDGIQFMFQNSDEVPFDFFFMLPSCVPASPLETSGATLEAADLLGLKGHPRVLGLAEVMNFPAVLQADQQMVRKITSFSDEIIDGHCPLLSGHDLQAYLTAGIRSDHETTGVSEAVEKLRSGMRIMVREGSTAKSLETLLPLITKENSRQFCIVSDDLHAHDIRERGHLEFCLKKAVRLGMDPITAVQLVSRNVAEYFGLKDRGAIAPGYSADIVVVKDLERFEIDRVYKDGNLMVASGELIGFPEPNQTDMTHLPPINLAPAGSSDLQIPHPGAGTKARIIELVSDQIITHQVCEDVKMEAGMVQSETESDVLKLCVLERHHASGRIGLGLVRGFGLTHGAIGSTVAHDSHNIIVVGVKDEEIETAVNTIQEMGGGLVVVEGKEVLAKVPLPIGGLMSAHPLESLLPLLQKADNGASRLGCKITNPFMALSFLSLAVIPELKLTDRGLVDVNRFEVVPLFAEN